MTQGFKNEFETIELLVNSKTKTGRTDAFIIAFTKLEKQARRIFTYIVFQYPAFDLSQYRKILTAIASKRHIYFEDFIKGFDCIYLKTFEDVVGSALYKPFLSTDFPRIQKLRNKILHGQPTGKNLSAADLKKEIDVIKRWCEVVSNAMMTEIGFDGLEWNSFRKNHDKDLASTYKTKISDLDMLDTFMEMNMNR